MKVTKLHAIFKWVKQDVKYHLIYFRVYFILLFLFGRHLLLWVRWNFENCYKSSVTLNWIIYTTGVKKLQNLIFSSDQDPYQDTVSVTGVKSFILINFWQLSKFKMIPGDRSRKVKIGKCEPFFSIIIWLKTMTDSIVGISFLKRQYLENTLQGVTHLCVCMGISKTVKDTKFYGKIALFRILIC